MFLGFVMSNVDRASVYARHSHTLKCRKCRTTKECRQTYKTVTKGKNNA